MKKLSGVKKLKGKVVLVRVDFNVPVENGIILDDFRIKKTLPTIEKLRSLGAKVILISHFEGRGDTSLNNILLYLNTFFSVTFVEDIFSKDARQIVDEMKDSDVVLFENLRKWKGEKENDKSFAKHLASFADIYVNEAFSASHREHASIVGIPKNLPSYAGDLFSEELGALKKVLSPQRPFLFILGGAKFSTKLPLLKKFLKKADRVVIAGALMNNFYKEQGFEVGKSIVENGDFGIKNMLKDKHLYIPGNVIVETKDKYVETRDPSKVQVGDIIMDVGPDSIGDMQTFINESKFILWNGPLGNYENGYDEGTKELAHRIAEGAKDSIVGGGDTLTVISKLNLLDKYTFVSTAGGAMLDFLANETLPGIEALG